MFRLVLTAFLAFQSHALLSRVSIQSLAVAQVRENVMRRVDTPKRRRLSVRSAKFMGTHPNARNSIHAHDEACVQAACAGVPEECMDKPGARKVKFGWKHPAGAMRAETDKMQRNYDTIVETCGEMRAIAYLDAHDALTTEPPIWEKRVANKYPNKYEERATAEAESKAQREQAKAAAGGSAGGYPGGASAGADASGYSDDDCEAGYYLCKEEGQIFCCPYDDYNTGAAYGGVDDYGVGGQVGAPGGAGAGSNVGSNLGSGASGVRDQLPAPTGSSTSVNTNVGVSTTRSTSSAPSAPRSSSPVEREPLTQDEPVEEESTTEEAENFFVKNLPYIAGGAIILMMLIIVAVKVSSGGKKAPKKAPKRAKKGSKGKKKNNKPQRTRGTSN